jgi:ribose/xylose/arabinose/galactoside ABC-type transport system permease subunit
MGSTGKEMKSSITFEKLLLFIQKRVIVTIFIVAIIILAITVPNFFTLKNFFLVMKTTSAIGITTIGMGILLIMGQIDLSVGSLMAFAGVFSAVMVSNINIYSKWLTFASSFGIDPVFIAILTALLAGAAVGAFNGIVVAKGKVPPFIVTLGTMTICRGLAYILSKGMPVAKLLDSYTVIGGGRVSLSATDPSFNINYTIFVFVAVIIVISFIMKKRKFGRFIYAIGGNEKAALAAGINVDLVKIQAYTLEGTLVGLAGMLSISRLTTAQPGFGTGYELDAIAGCIIGGISFNGGIGTIMSGVVGALILTIIQQGMDMLSVQTFYQQIVKGAIIILAVLLDRKRVV